MENHPNFHDNGHFSNHSQAQNGSIYNGLIGDGVAEGLSFEEGLDDNHLQPLSLFEFENGSAQLSFTTDFISSQLSSHIAFGYAGNNYFNLTWLPQEATEAHNWLQTSNASAVHTNFRQEIHNGDRLISPSITIQPVGNEDVEPPVYAPQKSFAPLPDGASGESPLYNHSLGETLTQRPRSVDKPKLRASKFYCDIRPCNHLKGFTRKADLKRHLVTQHSHLYPSKAKWFHCPWLDCERKGTNGFSRRDKMLQHQNRVHGRRLPE